MENPAFKKYTYIYNQHQSSVAQGEFTLKQLNAQIIHAKDVNPNNLSAYDYQGINWLEVAKIPREIYLHNHKLTYNTHRQHNQPLKEYKQPNRVANGTYYKINKFYQGVKPKYTHFQLKNCVQAISHHDLYFMGNEQLNHLSTLRENIKHYDVINNYNTHDWDDLRGYRYVAFSVDEEGFALGGLYGGLYYQNIQNNKSIFIKNITEMHTDPQGDTINYVKLYKEGNSKKLITAQNDKYVQIYDLEYHYQPKQRILCNNPVNIANINPVSSEIMAIFADQNDAELIDLRSNSIIATLQGHQDYGLTLSWNPNGMQLATGNQDKTTRIWDLRNLSKSTHILQTNMGGVSNLKYDSTGQYLCAMECSDYLNIYDVSSDYKNFQVIDYIGSSTGLDIYGDKIYVGVHLNDYNGIFEIEKNKQNNSYQSSFESYNI